MTFQTYFNIVAIGVFAILITDNGGAGLLAMLVAVYVLGNRDADRS